MKALDRRKYSNFSIMSWSGGFKYSDGLISIASYLVTGEGITAAFAFAVSALTTMSHNLNPDDLLVEAEKIIESHIDTGKVNDRKELTFEYHPNEFIEVTDPKWWVKSLDRDAQ